jgi:hypothetical protein
VNPSMGCVNKNRAIYCCGCVKEVLARLTDGAEIYPHRTDLHSLPFWKCDTCKNYVGCHHKTSNPTNPLGVIPTREITNARKRIHVLLDSMWSSGKQRGAIYAYLSRELGYSYHTANIKSMDEARKVYKLLTQWPPILPPA